MKTAIVISDTHGNRGVFDKLEGIFSESDYIIHLGDTSLDGSVIRKKYPQKTFLLNGNCDLPKLGEDEHVFEIEDVRIFACHGDRFGVKSNRDKLCYKAQQENCTVALYGHTHKPLEEFIDGVTLLNPGTLNRYSANTYLYLVINKDKLVYKIVEL
jgi:putative phosphoesterase